MLGGNRIAEITQSAKEHFKLKNAEITVEANPADNLSDDLKTMAEAGVNRLSLGVQSAVDDELKALSRRHCCKDVVRTVNNARIVGIDNISVDLMLGIPYQTMSSLKTSLDFILSLEPQHISCYILKIEPDTPFGKADTDSLFLASEDTVADMYLYTSEYLRKNGFEHYEISNFAKPGYRSKHNMKYWQCKEYLGLGPAAHSFLNGKRFYFERDLYKYLSSPEITDDGDGGDSEEYIMLRMRTSDGLSFSEYENIFGKPVSDKILKTAAKLSKNGLVKLTDKGFSLTVNGYLLSNSCISELLM